MDGRTAVNGDNEMLKLTNSYMIFWRIMSHNFLNRQSTSKEKKSSNKNAALGFSPDVLIQT